MLYFQSSSTARGQVTINVILEKGIDPDIAQVQVQMRYRRPSQGCRNRFSNRESGSPNRHPTCF